MNPEDERDTFWKAIGTVDDRVSGLESVVRANVEMTRESIKAAVREAMPSALISDDEHRWVKMSIEREAKRAQFRQKIIDSSTFWAVPTLLGALAIGLWTVIREYLVAHGMWRP